jgi:hypothetical protein
VVVAAMRDPVAQSKLGDLERRLRALAVELEKKALEHDEEVKRLFDKVQRAREAGHGYAETHAATLANHHHTVALAQHEIAALIQRAVFDA